MLHWSEFMTVLSEIMLIANNFAFNSTISSDLVQNRSFIAVFAEPLIIVAHRNSPLKNTTGVHFVVGLESDLNLIQLKAASSNLTDSNPALLESVANYSVEMLKNNELDKYDVTEIWEYVVQNENYIGIVPISAVKNSISPQLQIIPLRFGPNFSAHPISLYTYFWSANSTCEYREFLNSIQAAAGYFGVDRDLNARTKATDGTRGAKKRPTGSATAFEYELIIMMGLLIAAMALYQIQRCRVQKRRANNSMEETINEIFVSPLDLEVHIGCRYGSPVLSQIDSEFFMEDSMVFYCRDRALMFRGPHVPVYSRKSIHLMLKSINFPLHPNLLKFFGVVKLKTCHGFLFEGATKGCLHDTFQAMNFDLGDDVSGALANDAASGLEFLHDQGLHHGRLSSFSTFLDAQWSLKVADYVQISLDSNTKSHFSHDSETPLEELLFVDPQILSREVQHVSKKSDIYSYGMLLIEIYTMQLPFAHEIELYGGIDNVLGQIKRHIINPDLKQADIIIPEKIQRLIAWCSRPTPGRRPNTCEVQSFLERNVRRRGVADSIMEAMEGHTRSLENDIQDKADEIKSVSGRMEKLLESILPKEVAYKLQRGETVNPEYFEQVTVYFSDILGFTQMCSEASPIDIVNMLNTLFTQYDSIIEKYDVYKVETIGDAYMVASGLPTSNGVEHVRQIVKMALSIVKGCEYFVIPHKMESRLEIRIGINSGPITAGVIGQHMPRYCLFGDTVNTASRMESTGVANKIHASASTANIVMINFSEFKCEYRGETFVKGKGEMSTYFISPSAEAVDEDDGLEGAVVPIRLFGRRKPKKNLPKIIEVAEALQATVAAQKALGPTTDHPNSLPESTTENSELKIDLYRFYDDSVPVIQVSHPID